MGCNEKKPKKELIRVVRTPEGQVILDTTGKKSGRGAYICPCKKCFDRAYKSKRLENVLQVQIPQSVYDELTNYLSEVSALDV